MFPHRTDLLAASSAVMHISADSRPPVRPPCPLFPCSTPSELAAFTQSHALSWDELQQHGGQADLVQCVQSLCTVKSIPVTVSSLIRCPVNFSLCCYLHLHYFGCITCWENFLWRHQEVVVMRCSVGTIKFFHIKIMLISDDLMFSNELFAHTGDTVGKNVTLSS